RSRLLREQCAADAHRRRDEELVRLRGNQRHARAAQGLNLLPEGAAVSFAVRIDSAPQALHRRLQIALVAFAIATSSFAFILAEPAARGWIALAALVCFAVALGRWRLAEKARRPGRPRRRLPSWIVGTSPAVGSLSIDDAGRASWTDAPDCTGGAVRPVRIERWNLVGPFAWLRLRV